MLLLHYIRHIYTNIYSNLSTINTVGNGCTMSEKIKAKDLQYKLISKFEVKEKTTHIYMLLYIICKTTNIL